MMRCKCLLHGCAASSCAESCECMEWMEDVQLEKRECGSAPPLWRDSRQQQGRKPTWLGIWIWTTLP